MTEKLSAISVRSATGINSDVQKIKVETVIPANGSASFQKIKVETVIPANGSASLKFIRCFFCIIGRKNLRTSLLPSKSTYPPDQLVRSSVDSALLLVVTLSSLIVVS